MPKRISPDLVVFGLLTAMGILGRLVPHPPNFTPIAATALFAGFFFRSATVAACVPVAALIVGDLVTGAYDPRLMAVVYASLVIPLACRSVLRRRLSPLRLALCSMISSVIFFAATNLAVWLFGDWYPRTLAGLTSCMIAGVPFFRNTVCGDLAFSAAIFSCYAVAVRTPHFAARTDCGSLAATA